MAEKYEVGKVYEIDEKERKVLAVHPELVTTTDLSYKEPVDAGKMTLAEAKSEAKRVLAEAQEKAKALAEEAEKALAKAKSEAEAIKG